MSDLHRSAIAARLAKIPPVAPNESDEDEDNEAMESMDALGTLSGPSSSFGQPRLPKKRTPNPAYTPISAEGYFEQAIEVEVLDVQLNFRVYYSLPKANDGTLMICHHGAGYSALSFACFAKEVSSQSGTECGVLAMDARRHGKTTASGPDDNLDIEVLSNDLYHLLRTIFPDATKAPTFLLVGHSMGGSVIVRACPRLQKDKYRIAGVAVLDVVEGTAIDALPHMHSLLNSRPDGFGSLEDAIEWHLTTHTIRNPISARISVPHILLQPDSTPSHHAYTWRTPLRSTAPYWESWFRGLSTTFLQSRTARLLVLAGTERLDRELMIGQMQGKFQLEVVPDTGHMIHEDNPVRLAEILVGFWRRNERVVVGVKKVGDL